jgi:hypothetical protein
VTVPDLVELIGYLASGLIVVSLLMSSVLRLRLINLVGSGVFTAYGVLIASPPVIVANAAIVLINLYHLSTIWRARAEESYFEVVAWPTGGVYLPRFLSFHRDDIARHQPDFAGLRDDHTALVVLRDAVPVGLVLLRDEGDGRARIDLDYVIPAYRDLRAAMHLYRSGGAFHDRGIRTVTATAATDVHRRYLERMGFEPEGDHLAKAV